jgi:hypothetical protein
MALNPYQKLPQLSCSETAKQFYIKNPVICKEQVILAVGAACSREIK